MGTALEHIGARTRVARDAVATIALALFQGLVRQRRIDPASVPDELLGQAMRWLFAGSRRRHCRPPAPRTTRTGDPATADRPEESR